MQKVYRKVYRNWGYYIVLLSLPFFKIKLLIFNGKLSYQYHLHRYEFWIRLFGQGKFFKNGVITKNNRFFLVKPCDIHSFLGKSKIIEFQFGKKVLESDITRMSENNFKTILNHYE